MERNENNDSFSARGNGEASGPDNGSTGNSNETSTRGSWRNAITSKRGRTANFEPIAGTGNGAEAYTKQEETDNEKDSPIPEIEGIKLSFEPAPHSEPIGPKKRPTKSKPKLTVAEARKAGESAAKKLCDFVSIGAVWATKVKSAAMQQEERDGIEPPLARILAKFDIVSQLDTGSDVVALLTATSLYAYRVYVEYQISRLMASQPQPSSNGTQSHDEAPLFTGDAPENFDAFVVNENP